MEDGNGEGGLLGSLTPFPLMGDRVGRCREWGMGGRQC